MTISKNHPSRQLIEDRLKELSLGYQKDYQDQSGILQLSDHDWQVISIDDILQHLDEIEHELPDWYRCSCE
ncbi:MAG: hypothetical protein AAFV95_18675 [Bacteroidota bacterium]